MLLDKSISVGDVITLKLVGGEELIARFESEEDAYVKVNRPLSIVATSSLGMIPWIFLGASETVKINRHSIVAGPMLSKKEAADQYLQGTTGIALA
jgi:hypothetical protein